MNKTQILYRLKAIQVVVNQKKRKGIHREPSPIETIRSRLDSLIAELELSWWDRVKHKIGY